MKNSKKFIKILCIALGAAAALVLFRFCLPLGLPFLVGALAALAAEPLTRLLERKLPRSWASGIAMVAVYAVLCLGLYLLGRLLLMELNRLTGRLPQLAQGAQDLILRAEQFFYGLAERAPEHLRQQLMDGMEQLLGSSAELARQAAGRVLGAASRMILRLPDTFIFLVTALTAGFLISPRLPKFKPWLMRMIPEAWQKGAAQMLANMRGNVGLWLRAQCKLLGVTFCLLAAGFLLLRVKNAILTAALICLVDALPVLGVGTVLLPWAAVCLLQGQTPQAIALASMYAVVTLTRSSLEPRLVGRQLGLSPLLTLGGLYVGYRLWGLAGMLLAPFALLALGEVVGIARGEPGRK